MLAPYPLEMDADSLLDRRRHPRRRGGEIRVLLSDHKAEAPPFEGAVEDRSSGGLCLAASRFVPAGSMMSVRPVNAPDLVPWIQVEVVYCTQRDKVWILGCQFTHLVPWSVRVLFG